MIPGVPWIASAVESCLSCYLGLAEQASVQVSDDGGSLHFTPHGLPHPTLAVIDQVSILSAWSGASHTERMLFFASGGDPTGQH